MPAWVGRDAYVRSVFFSGSARARAHAGGHMSTITKPSNLYIRTTRGVCLQMPYDTCRTCVLCNLRPVGLVHDDSLLIELRQHVVALSRPQRATTAQSKTR